MVVACDLELSAAIEASGSDLLLSVFIAGGSFCVAEVQAARSETFRPRELHALAANLSSRFGAVVSFEFDSRVGYRAATHFANGEVVGTFGVADELWVELGEEGDPLEDSPQLLPSQLKEGVEYETAWNAIDLALRSLGGCGLRWSTLHAALSVRPAGETRGHCVDAASQPGACWDGAATEQVASVATPVASLPVSPLS